MAHKTNIGGTAYNVVGGTSLVSGTAYSIKKGRTLVDGTEYNINFILNGKEINLNNRLYTKVDNKYQINKFKFETNNIVEFKGRIGIYRKFNKSIVVLCLYYNDLNYVVPIDDHIESI